jgi:hypothetical protein
METDDPKKVSSSKAQKSLKNGIKNWWIEQNTHRKIIIIITFFIGIMSIMWIFSLLMPDEDAQKLQTLNQMELLIGYAQPTINDPRTTIYVYVEGGDKNTALNKLQSDKTTINELIPQVKSINPPDELQHSHSLFLSSLQESIAAINLAIDGINSNNSNKIAQARVLDDNATTQFDEASNEIFILRYNNQTV